MTDSGNQITWTFPYNVPAGSDGTTQVTIAGATDEAGNPNAAATNDGFTIDNTGPTVAITYNPDRNVRDADTLTIMATFGEAINGTPTIAITTSGDDLAATAMTDSGDQITWTYSYDVPAASDGTTAVTIAGATDEAGNPNAAATNAGFTIDNTRPTVALTYNPDRNVRDADTLTITATFNEPMNATPTITINTSGDDLAATAMTGNQGDTVWTYSYDVPAASDGDTVVTISGTDLAGNPNDAATNENFTIDNTDPTVALTYNPDRDMRNADTLTITATFNEPMNATPTIAINTSGDDLAATAMTGNQGDTVWTYSYDVPAASDGATVVTISGTDLADNSNTAATNETFTIDNTDPTVAITYNPDRDLRDDDTPTITATFNEPMNATPTIAINTSGDDLTATAMTGNQGDTVWTYSYDVPAGSDGTAEVAISGTDLAGNPNDDATSATFTIDNTGPTVAITYNPDRNVQNADTLTITATFGEAINGTPTIAITTSGDDLAATAMTDSGDQITWTYSYDVPAASDGDTVVTISGTDLAGNPNDAATNENFTIDNTDPTVALTYNPDRDMRNADTLTITATFNEPMNATPTIAINTSGDDLAATAMTGNQGDTVWTYSYDVPAASDGATVVTISGTDLADNSNTAATNETFTIDNTDPTVAITYNPDRDLRDDDTPTITATFNEPMNATPTIAINTSGDDLTATAMTGNQGDTVWTYSYDVPAGSDGTAEVAISGTDLAGNPNDDATSATFTIDNTGPTVAITYNPDRNVQNADTLTITATFGEAINGTPTIAITTSGDDLAATAMTDSGDQITWTYSYDVPAASDGTTAVTIAGATDEAGNPNAAATNAGFTIDNTAPTVAFTYDPDRNVLDADTLTITATFNEPMNATPTITINTSGDDLAATAMTGNQGDTVWTYSYDVPAASDGATVVTISGTDLAGNPNDAATNETFTIDNTNPTVALTYNPDRNVRNADTLTITATFNEAMNAAPTIAINTSGDDLAATAMTGNQGDTVWTYSYDVPAASDGTAGVTISGTDLAGNANDAATNATFTIDNTDPTVAITYNPDRDVRDDDTPTITATFNEAINGTPTIAIDTQGTDQAATAMTDSGDQITWTFVYEVPAASSGEATVIIADATDDAENPNATATNNTFEIL